MHSKRYGDVNVKIKKNTVTKRTVTLSLKGLGLYNAEFQKGIY